MALPATDNFNYSPALSASWTTNVGTFRTTGTYVRCENVSVDSIATWNADAFPNDQYAQFEVRITTANAQIGLALRSNNSASVTCYVCTLTNANTYCAKMVAGVWTEYVPPIAVATSWVAGDILKFTVIGSQLRVYRNAVEISGCAKVDATIASGSAGLHGYGNDLAACADNWEGGSLAAQETITVDKWFVRARTPIFKNPEVVSY